MGGPRVECQTLSPDRAACHGPGTTRRVAAATRGAALAQRVAGLMRPLTDGQMRYVTMDQLDVAYAWINEFEAWDPLTPVLPNIP